MENPDNATLFLDRDGIINKMVAYPDKAEQFDSPQNLSDVSLCEGITNIISWANDRNIPVIEITNQPSVAKGKMDQKNADAIEVRIHELLRIEGVKINKIYICPHHPKGILPELTMECDCRKPKPGLLFQASKELGIDLNRSIFLGDSASDAKAGKAAGCKTIIFLHKNNMSEKVAEATGIESDYKVKSLSETIPILKNYFKRSGVQRFFKLK